MDDNLSEIVCNRYYYVELVELIGSVRFTGYMLNYNSGNIVLLTEKGIFHAKYTDIRYLYPITNPSEELKDIVGKLNI